VLCAISAVGAQYPVLAGIVLGTADKAASSWSVSPEMLGAPLPLSHSCTQ